MGNYIRVTVAAEVTEVPSGLRNVGNAREPEMPAARGRSQQRRRQERQLEDSKRTGKDPSGFGDYWPCLVFPGGRADRIWKSH